MLFIVLPLIHAKAFNSPTITSAFPNNPKVGDTLSIIGTGFDPGNLLLNKFYFNHQRPVVYPLVEYDSIQGEIVDITETTIRVIVPIGAYYGNLSVSVNGVNSTSEIYFGVTPTITSFIPNTGTVGDTITITGTGFNWGQAAANHIWFTNGWNTTAISVTQTSLKVIVPTGSNTGPVRVNGVWSSFDFNVGAMVAGISPTSGYVGAEVAIYGTGFDPSKYAEYQITFNGVPVDTMTIYPTFIQTIVPNKATPGVVIFSYNGQPIGGTTLNYEVILNPPIVYGYSAYSGTVGSPVTIYGKRFDQMGLPIKVQFGNVFSEIERYTNDTIYTTVPKAAQLGPIVINIGDSYESGPFFRVLEKIDYQSEKYVKVGDTITLVGSGFNYYMENYYEMLFLPSFSGVTPISVSDTSLSFIVPYYAVSGNPLLQSNGFMVMTMPYIRIVPVITDFTPDTVITGRRQAITINGTGLGRIQNFGEYKIVFGGDVEQTNISQNNHTDEPENGFVQVRVTVPDSAKTGPIRFLIDSLVAISPKELIVVPDTFPYKPEPPDSFSFTSATSSSVTMHWNRPYRALGFLLELSADNFATNLLGFNSVNIADTLKILSGLQIGTDYLVRIRSYSDTDTSLYILVSVPMVPPPPIAQPAVKIGEKNFLLQWSESTGAMGYFIDLSIDNFATIETFSWSDNQFVIEVIDNALASFGYRVRAYNGTGISDPSNTVMVVITKVENTSVTPDIFPNPAQDYIKLDLAEQVNNIFIVDNSGRPQKVNAELVNGTYTIDIRHLSKGLYLLKILTTKNTLTYRFLKLEF